MDPMYRHDATETKHHELTHPIVFDASEAWEPTVGFIIDQASFNVFLWTSSTRSIAAKALSHEGACAPASMGAEYQWK